MLRAPEGHDDPPADPPADPSLVNVDPPADPPVDPNKPADPPVDPNKPADPPKPAEEPVVVEPLTTDALTFPEGFEAQPELTNKFLEILNGDMAPQDRANALIALQADAMTQASETSSKAWEDMQTEWKDAVKADPEIGGDKLQPTLNNIGKLINEFGSDELKGAFDLTGAGNNPHVIKFLGKIAEKLTEGNFFTAGTPGKTDDPNAAARRMFPSATS